MSSPSPVIVLFARGILARLALWPALRIAVHNSWGGPESAEKQRWLAGVIVDQYENHIPRTDADFAPSTSQTGTTPDASYIEEMLLQIMVDEFEVILEDNSAYEVARDVVRLWEDVYSGRDTLVKEWEDQAGRYVPQVEEGARSGSDWEETSDDEGRHDRPLRYLPTRHWSHLRTCYPDKLVPQHYISKATASYTALSSHHHLVNEGSPTQLLPHRKPYHVLQIDRTDLLRPQSRPPRWKCVRL